MANKSAKTYTLDQVMATYWDAHQADYDDDQGIFVAMREFEAQLDAMVDWRLRATQKDMALTKLGRAQRWINRQLQEIGL